MVLQLEMTVLEYSLGVFLYTCIEKIYTYFLITKVYILCTQSGAYQTWI